MTSSPVPVWPAYLVVAAPIALVAIYIIDKVRKDKADER